MRWANDVVVNLTAYHRCRRWCYRCCHRCWCNGYCSRHCRPCKILFSEFDHVVGFAVLIIDFIVVVVFNDIAVVIGFMDNVSVVSVAVFPTVVPIFRRFGRLCKYCSGNWRYCTRSCCRRGRFRRWCCRWRRFSFANHSYWRWFMNRLLLVAVRKLTEISPCSSSLLCRALNKIRLSMRAFESVYRLRAGVYERFCRLCAVLAP